MDTACEDATTEEVDLSMFTAKVNVTMNKESSDELVRCMKKAPPADLEYSLIYVRHLEHALVLPKTD